MYHQHTQRSSKIYTVILVVAIIAGASYILFTNLRQTQQQGTSLPIISQDSISRATTYEWREYRNVRYGYTFKYPDNRTPYEAIDPVGDRVIRTTATSKHVGIMHREGEYATSGLPISLRVMADETSTQAEQWITRHRNEYLAFIDHATAQSFTINGRKGISFIANREQGSLYRLIIIEMRGHVLIITQDIKSTLLESDAYVYIRENQ
jgi:hypothetical protein